MQNYPFSAIPLPYDYTALIPAIGEETLHFHHDKHYVTYVTNLNNLLEANPEWQSKSLEDLLMHINDLPENIRTPIQNNAGGVYNHELYFNCMSGNGNESPSGKLAEAITKTFTSLDALKKALSAAAIGQFGSGYAWLVLDNGTLKILSTPNQNTPISETVKPLLCIDVWEHAYYLDYQNRRPDYANAWGDIINWKFVSERYENLV